MTFCLATSAAAVIDFVGAIASTGRYGGHSTTESALHADSLYADLHDYSATHLVTQDLDILLVLHGREMVCVCMETCYDLSLPKIHAYRMLRWRAPPGGVTLPSDEAHISQASLYRYGTKGSPGRGSKILA